MLIRFWLGTRAYQGSCIQTNSVNLTFYASHRYHAYSGAFNDSRRSSITQAVLAAAAADTHDRRLRQRADRRAETQADHGRASSHSYVGLRAMDWCWPCAYERGRTVTTDLSAREQRQPDVSRVGGCKGGPRAMRSIDIQSRAG